MAVLNTSKENQSLLAKRRLHRIKHPTEAELHVKRLLDELGERYIFNKGFYTSHRFYIVDFYIKRRRKLCLEIDGGYHQRQKDYDKNRDWFLTKHRKLRVIRITNEQAMAMGAQALLDVIR